MILVPKWFGIFICEGQEVIEKRLFPRDAESIAERMRRLRNREILEEELDLSENIDTVAEMRQGSLGKIVAFDSSFIKPEDFGFDIEMLRQASLIAARESLSEADPGAYITEQVRAFDDLLAICNLMSERLREWYGMYFPMLERLVDDRRYSELVAKNPNRESIAEELGKEDIDLSGAEMTEEDLKAIGVLAQSASEVFRARERIEASIQRKMKGDVPNIAAVAGPIIGARLISLSGGLKRFASMPTSTVQLLGAEKAMFRHMKEKSRPPKHGVIFQHQLIHKAPYWQRGKIARALAGKISIAAKVDFYGSEDISSDLIASLENRIEEIRRQNPTPPKKDARKGKGKRTVHRKNRQCY